MATAARGTPRDTPYLRFRRIRVRITRGGLLYVLLTLFLGAAAVNTMNNLLYLVVAAMLALLIVSGVTAYLALRRLTVEVRLPREVFAGSPCPATFSFTNHRRRLSAYLLELEREGEKRTILEVPPGGSGEAVLPLSFRRRGRQPLGELTLTSPFPLGLFERGGRFELPGEVLVYPRPLFPPPELPPVPGEAGDGARRGPPGPIGDYRDHRAYLPGDGVRHIDWRAFARTGALLVKEFEEETAPPVLLELSTTPGADLEERIGRLTALVLRCHEEGRAVGLRLGTDTLPPGTGSLHRTRQLRVLALYSGGEGGSR